MPTTQAHKSRGWSSDPSHLPCGGEEVLPNTLVTGTPWIFCPQRPEVTETWRYITVSRHQCPMAGLRCLLLRNLRNNILRSNILRNANVTPKWFWNVCLIAGGRELYIANQQTLQSFQGSSGPRSPDSWHCKCHTCLPPRGNWYKKIPLKHSWKGRVRVLF